MDGWHVAHLMVLAAWGGLVAGELVVEVAGGASDELRRAAARFHMQIDLWVELPLLAGVVLTGAVLLARSQPDAALWVKVACGLGAVGVNVACAWAVVLRARVADDDDGRSRARGLTRWVFRSALVGVPLGAVALVIGGQRAGWW